MYDAYFLFTFTEEEYVFNEMFISTSSMLVKMKRINVGEKEKKTYLLHHFHLLLMFDGRRAESARLRPRAWGDIFLCLGKFLRNY
jgi:hypothetical protein